MGRKVIDVVKQYHLEWLLNVQIAIANGEHWKMCESIKCIDISYLF